MEIIVRLPAPYLSLELLVDAISEAVADVPRRGGRSKAPREEIAAAAALEWEGKLRQLADQRILNGHDFDTLSETAWEYLEFDKDLFFIKDLNSCKALEDAGLRFEVHQDEIQQELLHAAIGEQVYNNGPVDWPRWAALPVWRADQASRLLRGLDPVVFSDFRAKPNDNDANQVVAIVDTIQRFAEMQEKHVDSPKGWVKWAYANGVAVQARCEEAVLGAATKAGNQSTEYFGRKQRKITLAGSTTMFWATDEELADMEKEIADRQTTGRYRLSEAAQFLADRAGIDGGDMLKRLQQEFFDGRLTVRHPKAEYPLGKDDTLRPWMNIVFVSDMDKLLETWGAQYTFSDIVSKADQQQSAKAEASPAPAKKATRQQERILAWLSENGHDPLKLPPREPGRAGIKAACKTALLRDHALFSDRSFEKAWEELRRMKQVQGAD